jgi:hypothetical protein
MMESVAIAAAIFAIFSGFALGFTLGALKAAEFAMQIMKENEARKGDDR